MIYICGPMTDLPDYNYPAFNKAAADLWEAGYDVQNPADNPKPEPETWEGYMRNAITQMLTCDSVATLDGWMESKGACLEVHIAKALNMPVNPLFSYLAEAHKAANAATAAQAALAGQP